MKSVMKTLVIISFLTIVGFGSSGAQQQKLTGSPDIVPPATEEMQHPEFWISRSGGDPDRVIMTPPQIDALNKKNKTRKLEWKDINGTPVTFDEELKSRGLFSSIMYRQEDPLKITSFPGSRIRQDFTALREYLAGNLWDRRQIHYPEDRKKGIIDALDEQSIPETVKPQYGIIVTHTMHRMGPTSDAIYGGQYGWLDMFQKELLETGTPVAILHSTKDRDWHYVRSEHMLGWVPAASVAVGQERDIRRLAEPESFIVAITHKVPVFADRNFSTHLLDLYMGTRLTLVRKAVSGYEVLVPHRRADGALETVTGWIRPDALVHEGFQPFTKRNVIETFFRLLNRPYGWGGTDRERDCVGTIRAVYRTFGIYMPPWTTFMLYSTDHVYVFPKDTPKETKYQYLDKCEPAITVCGFNGHVVLYLGVVDGAHWIIHENGYSYHEGDTEVKIGRVSVNTTEIEGGGNIGQWTELSEFKP